MQDSWAYEGGGALPPGTEPMSAAVKRPIASPSLEEIVIANLRPEIIDNRFLPLSAPQSLPTVTRTFVTSPFRLPFHTTKYLR
jgi:hypothetical protein